MYTRRSFKSELVTLSTTVTLTDPILAEDHAIFGIVLESTAAWTAASITFQVGETKGGTFYNLYDSNGIEVAATVGGSERAISLDDIADSLVPYPYYKLRSGTAALAVTQASPVRFRIHMKG